jgi:hypothetical protein
MKFLREEDEVSDQRVFVYGDPGTRALITMWCRLRRLSCFAYTAIRCLHVNVLHGDSGGRSDVQD